MYLHYKMSRCNVVLNASGLKSTLAQIRFVIALVLVFSLNFFYIKIITLNSKTFLYNYCHKLKRV